jgi:hypothetical protein
MLIQCAGRSAVVDAESVQLMPVLFSISWRRSVSAGDRWAFGCEILTEFDDDDDE